MAHTTHVSTAYVLHPIEICTSDVEKEKKCKQKQIDWLKLNVLFERWLVTEEAMALNVLWELLFFNMNTANGRLKLQI